MIGIEKARFRRPVVPGDQLRIEVTTKMWLVPVFIFVVTFVMLVLIDPNSQFQSVNHRARVIQMPIGASSH